MSTNRRRGNPSSSSVSFVGAIQGKLPPPSGEPPSTIFEPTHFPGASARTHPSSSSPPRRGYPRVQPATPRAQAQPSRIPLAPKKEKKTRQKRKWWPTSFPLSVIGTPAAHSTFAML
jgi:hypothetical protein